MGYSDITSLHIAIRQRTGLATMHGPGLGSMGIPERTAFTWDSALEAFMNGGAGQVPRDPDDPYVRAIAPGVLLAHIKSTLTAPTGPLAGEHRSLFSAVLVQDQHSWRIAAFHNTLVA